MRSRAALGVLAGLTIVTMVTFTTAAAQAQTEKVLYSFQNNNRDGYNPFGGVIFDAAGNLYGNTGDGGSQHDCSPEAGCGAIFELTQNASGKWTEQTLHEFSDNGTDGFFPSGALTLDAAGNLYGTTVQGGGKGCIFSGCGTVFQLSAGSGRSEKILHRFAGGLDGAGPVGGLVLDPAGNLYGTTVAGGKWLSGDGGIVFELSPRAGGGWAEKILHNFGNGNDGDQPQAGLVRDQAGNLYGTTYYGGTGGTVFELSPQAGGGWTEKILHTFNNDGTDGNHPHAGLTLDASGNLYGTTLYGGHGCTAYPGCGVVFELQAQANGTWSEKILHYFDDSGDDGYFPSSGSLTLDGAGNLYGATSAGGGGQSGIVFELTPQADGTWTESIVHAFNQIGAFPNGFGPAANISFDEQGNLYGTAGGGGVNQCVNGCGLVFEIKR